MIQLRPSIALKIDRLSKDGVCIRISGWVCFYLIIMIVSMGRQNQYNEVTFQKKCDASESLTCSFCYSFQFPIQDFEIEMETHVNYTALHEAGIAVNPPRLRSEVFPPMHFTLYGFAAKGIGSPINCSHIESSYPTKLTELKNILSFECIATNDTHSKETNCKGHLDEVQTHGNNQFLFELAIDSLNYTKGFQGINFNVLFPNAAFTKFTIISQALFSLLTLLALYYLHSNLKEHPRENWLRIHKWIQYLLIVVLLYNLPLQVFRKEDMYLIDMSIKVIELALHTLILYFWLDVFELQFSEEERKYIWNLFKFLLVAFYTVPQALMTLYIFFEREQSSQFDPTQEIKLYGMYIKGQVGCLVAYSLLYASLLYKSFREKKLVIVEQTDIQRHDPFVEGLQIQQSRVTEIRNYKTLHGLSFFAFVGLMYYQQHRLLYPHNISLQQSINEQALLNVYICLITQLYMPFQDDSAFEEDKQKNVYGDMEMEDQSKEDIWKNVQKQIKDANEDDEI